MPDLDRRLRPAEGFRSREAASFYAQLEDQTRILLENLRGITPQELAWQPGRGMNTIGMLLAHNAVVEGWWTEFGLQRGKETDGTAILGINWDGDGMPLAADAAPFPDLEGKPLAFFEDLLARARAYFKNAASALVEADMEREIIRKRDDGSQSVMNVRWVLYHMHEHFAGHRGQIQMLRHLYAASVGAATR
ncbi:MAG TPA: DinB family protein [Candidatus Polarisedimenticolia bacterium]|nr:DinB family protein [Candidatus Polarisedimenticolia bacterium]